MKRNDESVNRDVGLSVHEYNETIALSEKDKEKRKGQSMKIISAFSDSQSDLDCSSDTQAIRQRTKTAKEKDTPAHTLYKIIGVIAAIATICQFIIYLFF